MRDVINKGVTEERVIEAVKNAFESGWSTIKLYFMIGLPYENIEDCSAIGELAEKIADEYFKVPKQIRNKGLRITVSTSIFVPKPFTPFQWAPMATIESVGEKIKAVKTSMRSKSITYNYHHSQVSYLEAVIARGDRRVCDVIIKAYENGAKFDGWTEHFNFEHWQKALEDSNVNGDFYSYRERSTEEILPWDFIDIGVNRNYLIKENEKAKDAELTQNCRLGCTGCGININFKEGECFHGALSN